MGRDNTAAGWGWPARLMHWVMAALILFQLGLGFWMVNLVAEPAAQFPLYQTHKSWGTVIFALALLRAGWRLIQRAPAMPEETGRMAAALAHGVHRALYVLMLVMPLTGWLMVSASPLQDRFGVPNEIFGLVVMPDPFRPGSAALEDLFRGIHTWSGVAMTLILAAHIGAALWHHVLRRDRVLMRMILGR